MNMHLLESIDGQQFWVSINYSFEIMRVTGAKLINSAIFLK